MSDLVKGTLYGIGVGPGDPELITLKAAKLIQAIPVISFLSADGKPGMARNIADAHCHINQIELIISMPMRVERAPSVDAYGQGAKAIATHLDEGRDVAFLCEGDPLFYGSFMYLLERLSADYNIEIVPGIASPMAAAAQAMHPLCARNDVFSVLPAPLDDTRLEAAFNQAQSIAIMKLGRHLPRITALLTRMDLAENTLYIAYAGLPQQIMCKLTDLTQETAPYFSMLLVSRDAELKTIKSATL